jgi:hypothetical protein
MAKLTVELLAHIWALDCMLTKIASMYRQKDVRSATDIDALAALNKLISDLIHCVPTATVSTGVVRKQLLAELDPLVLVDELQTLPASDSSQEEALETIP